MGQSYRWRKSSRSGPSGGDCIEVATNVRGTVAVRDSKDPAGGHLTVSPAEWATFLRALR